MGVPEPGAAAVTIAVKVTLCPIVDGFADDVTVVQVPSCLTTCDSGEDVLEERLVLPL